MERVELEPNGYGELTFNKDAKALQCLQCIYMTKILYSEDIKNFCKSMIKKENKPTKMGKRFLYY